ncbi:MAG: sigma-54 dependent transcriptional regulator [Desulfovibrionaceae bacterium]
MADILVIDDNLDFCFSLKAKIELIGHRCRTAVSCEEGLEKILEKCVEVVFLDVVFPGRNGIQAISEFKQLDCSPEVVIVTASADIASAEEAIRKGALDYLVKPLTKDSVQSVIEKAIAFRKKRLFRNPDESFDRSGIIGNSAKLNSCLFALQRASQGPASVLIRGETGTGKELFARAVHANSSRVDDSYVVVDCTNLPKNLAESLLFGHEKGAFTGADQARVGFFQQADGGTLFLDEIGDLDLSVQKSLLRVLQERKFRPLSSKREVKSDFRLVSATNRDIEEMVQRGEFRRDLYYRISNMIVEVPPLRERKEDIPVLVEHYLDSISTQLGKTGLRVSEGYYSCLREYGWPGNVRELVNVVQYSVANADNNELLDIYHLPISLRTFWAKQGIAEEQPQSVQSFKPEVYSSAGDLLVFKDARNQTQAHFELVYLAALAERSGGEIKKACQLSGLSRARLYELLQKHNLSLKS